MPTKHCTATFQSPGWLSSPSRAHAGINLVRACHPMPGTGIVLLDHIRISECPKQPSKSTTRWWYARSALGALARPGDGAAKLFMLPARRSACNRAASLRHRHRWAAQEEEGGRSLSKDQSFRWALLGAWGGCSHGGPGRCHGSWPADGWTGGCSRGLPSARRAQTALARWSGAGAHWAPVVCWT